MVTFAEYWEKHNIYFALRLITKDEAYKIWCDAIDSYKTAVDDALFKITEE